jgi:uncharacterized protein with GYD domain
MPIFLMFGKYSPKALKGVSSQRTKQAVKIIEKHGGKVISMYAVMGQHDLVFTLDLPSPEEAMLVSVELNKLTDISFTTSPVVDVEQFDKLMSKVQDL